MFDSARPCWKKVDHSRAVESGDESPKTLLSKTQPQVPLIRSHQVKFCCFDLSGLPASAQLISLSIAVFALSLTSATLDEYIFRSLPGYKFGWFTTTFELAAFALFAFAEWVANERTLLVHREAPLFNHLAVACAMTISEGFSNLSLTMLNYATQVIFKSMKLIVVMLGNMLMHRDMTRFSLVNYISAFLIMGSAAMFALVEENVSPRFSWIGIALVLVSLVFNAAHSNSQEYVLQTFHASAQELMIFGNICGACMALVACVVSGECLQALTYCAQNRLVILLLSTRNVFAYTSVNCYVLLIKHFGSVNATIITTSRKVLTITLSFIVFPKPFHWLYAIAWILFTIGTFLSPLSRHRARRKGLSKT